ncbi:MAG: Ig-like domain-containing protein [Prevotella sp.]|nr:Ig-like domain-containing protein [Prevotella sp.]
MKKTFLLKTMFLLCALVTWGNAWAADEVVVTLDNIGSGIGSTANTTAATTDITATGTTTSYTLNYYQCKKQGNAMLMTKSVNPYISNKTAMPGNIKSVQVFINSGASGKTTYDCAFSTTECTSATSGVGAVNITAGNNHIFSNLTGGNINVAGKFFCVTLGNAYNGQVLKLVITCEVSDPEDTRTESGISFAENEVELTWGDAFAGQALTNANSVDVTYSSTDEDVATVTSTGVVAIKKAGSTTIKATFAGDATYKPAVASYTLTINKAEAGLSYAQTLFDVVLNDNTFEAPALVNPNGLTVTYSSNNESVAHVDENTGEVDLVTSAEGTATITATFVGNDNFKGGSASYKIKVVDPSKKKISFSDNDQNIAGTFEQDMSLDYLINGVALSFSKATGSNNPRVDGAEVSGGILYARIYSGNTLTITGSANAKFKSITFDFNKGSISDGVNTYSSSNTTWTGTEHEVTFTASESTFINSITVSYDSEDIPVSAAGWATYYSSNALDFTGVTGLTAYTATKVGDAVKFNKVTGKVPANTGLLVSGTTANVPVAASADAVTNILKGVTAETVKTAGTVFVLKQGANGLGFYKNTNDFTVRANSAYLPATAVAGARAFIALDDEATGIENLTPALSKGEGVVLDLSGRRVAKPAKGLYIVNGKKVVVK